LVCLNHHIIFLGERSLTPAAVVCAAVRGVTSLGRTELMDFTSP